MGSVALQRGARPSGIGGAEIVTRVAATPEESFAAAFRAATTDAGWSLTALAEEVTRLGAPVTSATLSYWQRGLRRPGRRKSYEVVRLIEEVLGLESGSLLAYVTAPRVRGKGTRFLSLREAENPSGARVAQMLADLGMPDDYGYAPLTIHEQVYLDARGACIRRTTFQAMRSEQTQQGALWLGQIDERGVDGPGLVTDLSIGRVGGCLIDRYRRILCTRIDLPIVYRRGEVFLITYTVTYPPGTARTNREIRWLSKTLREYSLTLNFHPDALPEDVQEIRSEVVGDTGESTTFREVPVRRDAAQIVCLDVPPGTVGMRWRFAGERWPVDGSQMMVPSSPAALRAWQEVEISVLDTV